MAELNVTVFFYASAELAADPTQSSNLTASLEANASVVSDATSTTLTTPLSASASITAEAEVVQGIKASTSAGTFTFDFRGSLYVERKKVLVTQDASGTVDDIEDLPASPADGSVYNVLGLDTNREAVIAVYSTVSAAWYYQLERNTTRITQLNPLVGTNISMPDFINADGVPHTPLYWDKSELTYELTGSLENLSVAPAVSGVTIWRWKVEDLADPGEEKKYALDSWPETSGSGPTWHSKKFYQPQVKKKVKFNNKKNKTRKQRSVVFNYKQVDHMYITTPNLPQPFTVIMVGIIHSYPTAKYGHYLLDSGTEPPIYDANKTGKDFFFSEGTNPRNTLLYQKTRCRIGVNQQPAGDMKLVDLNIKGKHTERARPRMFYGVFNGSNSRIGSMDTKYTFDKTGALSNYGNSTTFTMGRRVNRISDNRASHMSIWDVSFIHKALSIEEIKGYYQEMSNLYQFKEYS